MPLTTNLIASKRIDKNFVCSSNDESFSKLDSVKAETSQEDHSHYGITREVRDLTKQVCDLTAMCLERDVKVIGSSD